MSWVLCSHASRIGSGYSSSATKSCAYASVVLPAGIISLSVDCAQYILLLVCFTTGPQPLPKPVLHTVRSSASSFNFQYPLFSLGTSSSCLCLLLRLLFPSVLALSFHKEHVLEDSSHARHDQYCYNSFAVFYLEGSFLPYRPIIYIYSLSRAI